MYGGIGAGVLVLLMFGSVHAASLRDMTAFANGQEVALPCFIPQLKVDWTIPWRVRMSMGTL